MARLFRLMQSMHRSLGASRISSTKRNMPTRHRRPRLPHLNKRQTLTKPQAVSAQEIQRAINASLDAAGLAPTYRVGLPTRIPAPAPGGPNWHFLDMLSGNIEEMTIATEILANARRDYTLKD